jgi:hypothetical protein
MGQGKSSTSAGERDQQGHRSQIPTVETESARFAAKMCEAEISLLQKRLADMVEGLNWIRTVQPRPWNFDQRLAEQKVKIEGVQRKLFRLRQRQLF